MTTDVNGTVYPASNGNIGYERLRWVIVYPEGSFVPFTEYVSGFEEVTCSGGIVTSFTGFVQDYFPGYGFVKYSDLELVRVD